MKLSEKIEELQKALAEYGDIDVVYSSDDEGNAYHEANHGGCLYARTEDGELPFYIETMDEEEYEEWKQECEEYDEEFNAIIVYCIN